MLALMFTAMWGVVARIAAAAAILTLVQHNISQMYKAYYDERMKEEAGPTKMFPKREEDADGHNDNGGARSARGGGGSRGERGGRRSFSTATAASVGAWAAAAVTSDALASHRRMNAPASASGVSSAQIRRSWSSSLRSWPSSVVIASPSLARRTRMLASPM